jgi:hypothetical protein
MRISKKRGEGEPEIKLLSADEQEKIKKLKEKKKKDG